MLVYLYNSLESLSKLLFDIDFVPNIFNIYLIYMHLISRQVSNTVETCDDSNRFNRE